MLEQRDIQRERLFYIDFLAFFTGRVSRKDLVTRFGISEPAATKDLSLYTELAPNALVYDLKQKCYVFGGGEILFPHEVDQALYSLAGDRAIAINTEHAKRLPSWVNVSIKRRLPVGLVAQITRAMYQHRKIVAGYVSLSSGIKNRVLSPLALVHDGLRWHIRAFDHEKEGFRDYNLARFMEATDMGDSDVDSSTDDEWNNHVALRLVAHPRAEHPETIHFDYEMANGTKEVTMPACLVGYFVRHWHIDCSDDAIGNPRAQQLFLANKAELLERGVSAWAFDP